MSDDDRPRNSILDLGETLLNGFVGGGVGSRWRKQVNEQLTDEDEIDYDTLLAAGVAAGEQVSRLRAQSRQTTASITGDNGGDGALVDVRDIYSPDGAYAGTRVTVSDPNATAYLEASGEELAVRSGGVADRVDLPQPAVGVEEASGDDGSVAEFVAFVAGGVVDPNHVTVVDGDADETVEDDDE
jgi:uncharacterized protein YfiM (DUF2279 family)